MTTKTAIFEDMTIDEAYNSIKEYFSRPGAKLAKAEGGDCLYRMEDTDGVTRACAVGCLIPDSVYDPGMEGPIKGGSVDNLAVGFPKLGLTKNLGLLSFLTMVQSSHDFSKSVDQFLRELDDIYTNA